MTRLSSNGRANYSVSKHKQMNDLDYPHSDVETSIVNQCNAIKEVLLEKNRKYGNSAINPKRIFSRADTIEQINVRIDDKLSRIASGQTDDTEDAELDLIGYLILKRVAIEHRNASKRIVDLEKTNAETKQDEEPYHPAVKRFLGYDDLEG